MSITLSAEDLNELQALLGDFRHKEASTLIEFFAQKRNRLMVEEAKKAAKARAALPADEMHKTNGAAHQAEGVAAQ